jgi:PAS domain S-box-containing protein
MMGQVSTSDVSKPGTCGGRAATPATERRRRESPATPDQFLEELPAKVLLHRLPTPSIAVSLDGALTYANPAFAALLGQSDLGVLTGRSVSTLIVDPANTTGRECVSALRAAAGTVVTWSHLDGYDVHTVVSKALLTRTTDPLLLITLIDVTDAQWSA